MNYKMNGLDKTIDELFAMLKTAEASMQKDPSHVLAMMNTTSFKNKGKGRNAKSGGKTKAQVKTKTGPTKKIMSVTTARTRGTGRGIARSIWET